MSVTVILKVFHEEPFWEKLILKKLALIIQTEKS